MTAGMKLPVYLDYSATTPVDPRVAAKMIPWLTEHFGNPASRSHAYGWEAEKAVEDAREEVAALVAFTGYAPGSPPREEVPASARSNPSAWRPVYARSTGYHPIPTSSGGYSFGK